MNARRGHAVANPEALACGWNRPNGWTGHSVCDPVEHKNGGVVASGADAGPGKSRQRRLLRGVRSPVQAIGVGMLALCLQNGLGLPEACNVVVAFFLGRNFDQLDRTLAPVTDRLRP